MVPAQRCGERLSLDAGGTGAAAGDEREVPFGQRARGRHATARGAARRRPPGAASAALGSRASRDDNDVFWRGDELPRRRPVQLPGGVVARASYGEAFPCALPRRPDYPGLRQSGLRPERQPRRRGRARGRPRRLAPSCSRRSRPARPTSSVRISSLAGRSTRRSTPRAASRAAPAPAATGSGCAQRDHLEARTSRAALASCADRALAAALAAGGEIGALPCTGVLRHVGDRVDVGDRGSRPTPWSTPGWRGARGMPRSVPAGREPPRPAVPRGGRLPGAGPDSVAGVALLSGAIRFPAAPPISCAWRARRTPLVALACPGETETTTGDAPARSSAGERMRGDGPAAETPPSGSGCADRVVWRVGDFVTYPPALAHAAAVCVPTRRTSSGCSQPGHHALRDGASPRPGAAARARLEALGVEVLALDTATYEGTLAGIERLGERLGKRLGPKRYGGNPRPRRRGATRCGRSAAAPRPAARSAATRSMPPGRRLSTSCCAPRAARTSSPTPRPTFSPRSRRCSRAAPRSSSTSRTTGRAPRAASSPATGRAQPFLPGSSTAASTRWIRSAWRSPVSASRRDGGAAARPSIRSASGGARRGDGRPRARRHAGGPTVSARRGRSPRGALLPGRAGLGSSLFAVVGGGRGFRFRAGRPGGPSRRRCTARGARHPAAGAALPASCSPRCSAGRWRCRRGAPGALPQSLADPYVLGISGGASVGGVVALALAARAGWGGAVRACRCSRFSARSGRSSPSSGSQPPAAAGDLYALLLTGAICNAFAGAAIFFVQSVASPTAARHRLLLMGRIPSPGPAGLATAAGMASPPWRCSAARDYNAAALGDEAARQGSGWTSRASRRWTFFWTALLAAVSGGACRDGRPGRHGAAQSAAADRQRHQAAAARRLAGGWRLPRPRRPGGADPHPRAGRPAGRVVTRPARRPVLRLAAAPPRRGGAAWLSRALRPRPTSRCATASARAATASPWRIEPGEVVGLLAERLGQVDAAARYGFGMLHRGSDPRARPRGRPRRRGASRPPSRGGSARRRTSSPGARSRSCCWAASAPFRPRVRVARDPGWRGRHSRAAAPRRSPIGRSSSSRPEAAAPASSARALAQAPRVLLLDEALSSLDLRYQVELCDRVRELAAEGVALVTVFHDLSLAAEYCDRVALLEEGRLALRADRRGVDLCAADPRLRHRDLRRRQRPDRWAGGDAALVAGASGARGAWGGRPVG